MGVLTDLAEAQVKRNIRRLYGRVLSQPLPMISDGIYMQYCCDVEISEQSPVNWDRQFGNKDEDDDIVIGLPGQKTLDLNRSLMIDTTLHNVPVSRNNNDLIYAEIGNPVILERTIGGKWEITGFAIEQPGTYTVVAVNLGDGTIGTIVDVTID